MKYLLITALFSVMTLTFSSCKTAKANDSTHVENENLRVKGKIIHIENGKDGYMATLLTTDNKEYIATISIVNLNKRGQKYKKYDVGETISIEGPFWKDDSGKTYITAYKLQ